MCIRDREPQDRLQPSSLGTSYDSLAEELNVALGGFGQAGYDVEKGCLAGAVWADEARDRAFQDFEVHVFDGDQATERLGQMDRPKNGLGRCAGGHASTNSWFAASASSVSCNSACRRRLGKRLSGLGPSL